MLTINRTICVIVFQYLQERGSKIVRAVYVFKRARVCFDLLNALYPDTPARN